MSLTTLEELGWIHDCVLHRVVYEVLHDGSRTVVLTLSCPNDLGYAPWQGRDLAIALIGVTVMKHIVVPVANPETVDAIRPGISTALHETMAQARQEGAHFPVLALTISCHSGSSIEVICSRLEASLLSLRGP